MTQPRKVRRYIFDCSVCGKKSVRKAKKKPMVCIVCGTNAATSKRSRAMSEGRETGIDRKQVNAEKEAAEGMNTHRLIKILSGPCGIDQFMAVGE